MRTLQEARLADRWLCGRGAAFLLTRKIYTHTLRRRSRASVEAIFGKLEDRDVRVVSDAPLCIRGEPQQKAKVPATANAMQDANVFTAK